MAVIGRRCALLRFLVVSSLLVFVSNCGPTTARSLRYVVSGLGTEYTHALVRVRYHTASGVEERDITPYGRSRPWTLDVEIPSGSSVSVDASLLDFGQVWCRIESDGKVLAESSSDGDRVGVRCVADVR